MTDLGADRSPGASFPIRTVAVIGAGRAGRSFALACAAVGLNVVLEDVMPAKLRRAQEEYADLEPVSAAATGRGQLRVALTVEDALREADLAIDFVPDELESKLEIFCLVDRMAPPRTILLTPSDALSITDLSSCTYRGDRCFAVRGPVAGEAFQHGRPVRLLHPEGARQACLVAVRELLGTLGCGVQVELDRDEPMLVKNYL